MAFATLEVGAGSCPLAIGFFAPCVVSDKRPMAGVHIACNAHALAFRDETFECVLVCNPWGFGFRGDSGASLLTELLRVLVDGGALVIVGASVNPNCSPARIRQVAATVGNSEYTLTVDQREIVASALYPGHRFLRSDGGEAIPNVETTIRRQRGPR